MASINTTIIPIRESSREYRVAKDKRKTVNPAALAIRLDLTDSKFILKMPLAI